MTASVILVPSASAVIVRMSGGQLAGISPRAGVSVASLPGAGAARGRRASEESPAGILSYGGGPVLHASAAYLVFWDPEGRISASSKALLQQYLTDAAFDSGTAGNVSAVARQYYDRSGFADYKQVFSPSQVILDSSPYPTSGNCTHTDLAFYPTCLTDQQLRSELEAVVSARSLPAGYAGTAPIYFLVTPDNVNVCTDASIPSRAVCLDNQFCSYHGYDPVNGALYAPIPLFFTAGRSAAQNPKACQQDGTAAVQRPNGDSADVALKYLSHEHAEIVTDPLADGSGWANGTVGNENGDECNATGPTNPTAGLAENAFLPTIGGNATAGTLFDQLIGGHPYYLQGEWSNGNALCELRPSGDTMIPKFTMPDSPVGTGTPVRLDPQQSTSQRPLSSETWTFSDGTPPIFVPAIGPPSAVAHAFARAGGYTVTLTLVDAVGNLASTSQRILVQTPPTARFAVGPSHPVAGSPVSFDAASSDPRGAIASYSWSFGDHSSPAVGITAHHTYATPGTYAVTLTATDNAGISATATSFLLVGRAGAITRISTRTSRSGTFLLVAVNGRGVVLAGSRPVRMARAGTATFKIALTRGERNTLARRHLVSVLLRVSFVPEAGHASRRRVIVTVPSGKIWVSR